MIKFRRIYINLKFIRSNIHVTQINLTKQGLKIKIQKILNINKNKIKNTYNISTYIFKWKSNQ